MKLLFVLLSIFYIPIAAYAESTGSVAPDASNPVVVGFSFESALVRLGPVHLLCEEPSHTEEGGNCRPSQDPIWEKRPVLMVEYSSLIDGRFQSQRAQDNFPDSSDSGLFYNSNAQAKIILKTGSVTDKQLEFLKSAQPRDRLKLAKKLFTLEVSKSVNNFVKSVGINCTSNSEGEAFCESYQNEIVPETTTAILAHKSK